MLKFTLTVRFRLAFGANSSFREFKEGRARSAVAYLLKQNHVLCIDEGTKISADT